MKHSLTVGFLFFLWVVPAQGAGTHQHHAVPTLEPQAATSVTIEGNRIVLTFGPIDLPAGHDGDLAASMPHHTFQVPNDMYLVGYKSAVFT